MVNNDRVVRLASGRILIPAAVHRTGKTGDIEKEASGPSENNEDGAENIGMERKNLYMDSRSEVMFFYSDDDGRSWMVSEGTVNSTSMPEGPSMAARSRRSGTWGAGDSSWDFMGICQN